MTDILLTWTENWAVWNKGSYGVGIAIDDVEANLPFEIKGFDCDNVRLRIFKLSPDSKVRRKASRKSDSIHSLQTL